MSKRREQSDTDRLRALLDECGVEWRSHAYPRRSITTIWQAGGIECHYRVGMHGREPLKLTLYGLTPKQAVEAALGRGECHVYEDGTESYRAYRCDVCGMQAVRWGNYCPSCGRRVVA